MSRIADMLIEIEELYKDGYSPEEISDMSGIQLNFVLEAIDSYAGEWVREYDEADPGDMDGDAESALASVGWGTDEDYGDWGADLDF